MEEKKYIPRLIDKEIEETLSVMGAVSIEGPKWCGKTMTSTQHSKSIIKLDDENLKLLAEEDPYIILDSNKYEIPELIDEWHLVPNVWDAVRRECDKRNTKGNFILTGSTTLKTENKPYHSGTGRIAKLKMGTMSLYESGDSTGDASLTGMFNNTQKNVIVNEISLEKIASLIIRGGWPENINTPSDKISIIPKNYIRSLLDEDINENGQIRNAKKMEMLLKSLARNETGVFTNQTIIRDIEEYNSNSELSISKNTVADYLDILKRLYIIEDQEAYGLNFRDSARIGKSPKRHLTDPSLSCALLNLNVEKLIMDRATFGLMFESLVERDLRVYSDTIGAKLYHFKDNNSTTEVDAIIEFQDGEYAAIEIKLSKTSIEDAKEGLLKFYNRTSKKPKFMCIIVGKYNAVIKDKETGIYILPITSLKP